jgi:uncharacterized protein (DUF4415 family)
MVRKPNPYLIDDDNPEWTDEELARARPAREVLPPELYAALTKPMPGQRGPAEKPPKTSKSTRRKEG